MYVCIYICVYIHIYICVWDTRHWGPTNPTRIIRPWNVQLEELHLFRLNVICLECDKISCASAGEAVPQLFSALRMGWFRFRISDLHVLLSLCVCIYICIYVYVQDRGAARGSAFWLRRANVFCILGFRRNGRIAYEICFQNTKPWTPKPKSDMKP